MMCVCKNNKDYSGGFTLLGTLFSAFLAIIVIAAIASLSAQVYGSSRNSRDRFIAVGLAKEGIELVRNIRDGNWLYYPQPADIIPVTKMKWRGDGVVSLCAVGTSCLRNLCDSGANYYTVDALSTDLGLVANGPDGLNINSDGYYTHSSGTPTIPNFSRRITIVTNGLGVCGEEADGDPLNIVAPKPNPITVTVTVSWNDSTNSPHKVELQESLYDWMMQRP